MNPEIAIVGNHGWKLQHVCNLSSTLWVALGCNENYWRLEKIVKISSLAIVDKVKKTSLGSTTTVTK